MATQASIDKVNMMYVAYYGRPGDPAGVTFWADVVDVAGGVLTAGVLDAFGTSAEYTDRFGSLTNDELIDNLYMQMFNRAADAAGKAFYVDLLTTGGSSLAEIALDIANGAQGSDLTILNNKINVAGYFTAQVAATGADYDSTNIDDAAAILAAVTDNPISVVTQKIAVNDYLVDLGGVDSTVTLTTAVDTVKITTAGTVDVINGVVDGDSDGDTSGSTFSIGDSITGNNKSVLKLAVVESGDAAFATVKNIGTVDLLAGVNGWVNFNAVDWTGIGQIQLNKGVNGMWANFSNLHAGVDLSVGSAVSGSLTADYTDGHSAWIFSDKGASISYMDGGDIFGLAGAGDDVSAEVWTTAGGVDLNIGNVTFSGAAADSAWFEVTQTQGMAGNVTIGDVSITGFDEIDFYVWNSDHTALSPAANTTIGDITLAVGKSGSISASIYNTGDGTVGNTTVGNVSLDVGPSSTEAYFYLYQWGRTGAGDVTVGNVSLTAGAEATDNNVWIENYAGYNGGLSVAPIMQGAMTVGDISVDLGFNATAYFSVSAAASTAAAVDVAVGDFTVGNLTATLAQDATLEVWLNNEADAGVGKATLGNTVVGDMNLDLAVDSSFSMTLDVSASSSGPAASVGNVTVGDLDLVMGINSDASFEYTVYAYGTDPMMVSIGNIAFGNVNAVVDDGAHLDWSISVTSYGVLGNVSVGDMAVAVGVSGDAHMYASFDATTNIGNVTIGDVDLTVGQKGSAYMSYEFSAWNGSVGDVTIGNINVAAATSAWASFEFSVEGETAIGDVTIGDVSISALGLNASASVEFDIENDSVGTIGAVTVGDVDMTVNGENAYGRFDISASSAASAGPVTVGDLDLAVGNAAKKTGSYLEVDIGNDEGNVVVGDINLTGSSVRGAGDATMTYSADVSIWATGSINIGNITVMGGDGAADNFRSFGSDHDWNADTIVDHGDTNWLTTTAGAAGVTIAGVDYSAYGTSAWIDVSGYKGAATIIGSAFGDLITDNIGTNSITGGAGADTFTFLDGNTGKTVATMDKITDFSNVSGDKIDLSVVVNVGNYGEASYADFAAFVTGANAADKAVMVGLVGSTGYAAVDYNVDGTVDFMIELTGLNSLGNIDVASFV